MGRGGGGDKVRVVGMISDGPVGAENGCDRKCEIVENVEGELMGSE